MCTPYGCPCVQEDPVPNLQIRGSTARAFVGMVSTCAGEGANAAPTPASDLEFFRLVNAWPERRFTAMPSHVDRLATNISLASYSKTVLEDGTVQLHPSPKPLLLDCRWLCSGSIFKRIYTWEPQQAACQLQWRPGVLEQVHQGLGALLLPLKEDSPADEAGLDVEMWQGPRHGAQRLANWMLEQGVIAYHGNHMAAYDMAMSAPDHAAADVRELVQRGILEQRSDEFAGDIFAVTDRALSWQGYTLCGQVALDVESPWHGECDDRSKLDLLVALLKGGWQPWQPHLQGEWLHPYRAGGAKAFDPSGIKRSKWYFTALLCVEGIMEKGVDQVLHDLPGSYYHLLCEGTAEQLAKLLELEHVRQCGHQHFQCLLKGQP